MLGALRSLTNTLQDNPATVYPVHLVETPLIATIGAADGTDADIETVLCKAVVYSFGPEFGNGHPMISCSIPPRDRKRLSDPSTHSVGILKRRQTTSSLAAVSDSNYTRVEGIDDLDLPMSAPVEHLEEGARHRAMETDNTIGECQSNSGAGLSNKDRHTAMGHDSCDPAILQGVPIGKPYVAPFLNSANDRAVDKAMTLLEGGTEVCDLTGELPLNYPMEEQV